MEQTPNILQGFILLAIAGVVWTGIILYVTRTRAPKLIPVADEYGFFGADAIKVLQHYESKYNLTKQEQRKVRAWVLSRMYGKSFRKVGNYLGVSHTTAMKDAYDAEDCAKLKKVCTILSGS